MCLRETQIEMAFWETFALFWVTFSQVNSKVAHCRLLGKQPQALYNYG